MRILYAGKHGSRSLATKVLVLTLALASSSLLLIGLWIGWSANQYLDEDRRAWQQLALEETQIHRDVVEQELATSKRKMQVITTLTARIQAQVQRMDALSESLVEVAGLPKSQFALDRYSNSQEASIGGSGDILGEAYVRPPFIGHLEDLIANLTRREANLRVLSDYLQEGSNLKFQNIPSNWPVRTGWISSHFGYRTDPFHGKLSFHRGIDFAGVLGNRVYAVAAGIVSRIVSQQDYGTLIEIDHGQGLKTRYAHNSEILSKLGDVVAKGESIASMGSTGRSTGPHVHFEVLKDGRRVNPATYISGGKRK